MTQPVYLTVEMAADILNCSQSHIRELIKASEYAGKPNAVIPKRLRDKVPLKFPAVLRIGKRGVRIKARDLYQWVEEQIR